MMKAIVYKEYGAADVLHLDELEQPKMKADEVLIQVKATSVNSGDWRLRKADPWAVRLFFGLTKPKLPVLGSTYAGVVVSTGSDVKTFKVGDQVFGHTDMQFGAYAEYLCQKETASIALMPSNISFEQAAIVPFGALTALFFVRKAQIQKGQKVLVNGASGAVGSAALQLAKYFGAELTAICSSGNAAMVRALGADHVIDYNREDFSVSGIKYDVIIDTVNTLAIHKCKNALVKKGRLITSAAGFTEMLIGFWTAMFSDIKVISGVITHSKEEMKFIAELIETGAYQAVLDRTYPLAEMAAAHRYVEQGHKKGNVAILVQ